MKAKSRLTFNQLEGEFPRASTILQICKKALEATGKYKAKEEHINTYGGMVHCLSIKETEEEMIDDECSVCHGEGYTYDHHDPCTECGGSGYYNKEGG